MKYISNSRHGSLLLSAIDEIAHKQQVPAELADKVKSETVSQVQALDEGSVSDYQAENTIITNLFYRWIEALDAGDKPKANKIEANIDRSVEDHPFPYAETKAFFNDKNFPQTANYNSALKNYRTSSDPGFGIVEGTVSSDARIGIIGDWGTGTDDSFYLLEEMLNRAPDMEAILHLGDIYQCGTPFECAQNFLDPINSIFKEKGIARIPIFTIPGNHEYITAARGYFELIDVLNSDLDPKWNQQASFFCLRSTDDKWQFLGADTGLGCINHPTEPGLQDSEVAWHLDRLTEFSGKSIMMCHHQFVSAEQMLNKNASGNLGYFNKRLLKSFQGHLDKIDLWIWGHDHWFLPYVNKLAIPTGEGTEPILQRGQLLGGSARETSTKKRNADSIIYNNAVQKDAAGNYIIPTASVTNDLTNHTYGIFDLKLATVSYYEIGAWDQGSPPNRTAPPNPLLVEQL